MCAPRLRAVGARRRAALRYRLAARLSLLAAGAWLCCPAARGERGLDGFPGLGRGDVSGIADGKNRIGRLRVARLASPCLAGPWLAGPRLAGPWLAGPRLAGPSSRRSVSRRSVSRQLPAGPGQALDTTARRGRRPETPGSRLRPVRRFPGEYPGSRYLPGWAPGSTRRTGPEDRRAAAGPERAGSHGPGPCPPGPRLARATRRPDLRLGRPPRLLQADRRNTRGRRATSRRGLAAGRLPMAARTARHSGWPALSDRRPRDRRTSHPGCACGERIAACPAVNPVGRIVGIFGFRSATS